MTNPVAWASLEACAAAIVRTIAPEAESHDSSLCDRWKQELMQAFLRGELRVIHKDDRRPIRPALPGAIVGALTTGAVTMTELNRWLEFMGSGIAVTAEAIDAKPKVTRLAAGSQTVRDAAARMADEWANEHFRMTGEIPAEEMVSKAIRVKLNAEFGRDWLHQTIRRHSLKDWSFSVISLTAQSAQAAKP